MAVSASTTGDGLNQALDDIQSSPHFDTATALKLYQEIDGELGMKVLDGDLRPAYFYRAENGLTASVAEHTASGELLEMIWQNPTLHVGWIEKAMARHSWDGYHWIEVGDIPEPDKRTMPGRYTTHDEPSLTWRCVRCGEGFEAGREFACHVWDEHLDVGDPTMVLRKEYAQKTLAGWSQ